MPESGLKLLASDSRSDAHQNIAFIAHFHPAQSGRRDRISQSLKEFVEGADPSSSRWISAAVDAVARELKFDLIVRALYPEETSASGTSSLDRFCEELSRVSGKAYGAGRLTKSRPTTPLENVAGRTARQNELANVFRFDGSGLAPGIRILVVDYIAETGATVEAIAAAIRASLPEAGIVAFVFGKVNGSAANSHLNPDYFSGTADNPAAAQSRAQRVPVAGASAKRPALSRAPVTGGVAGARRVVESRKTRPVSRGTLTVVFLAVVFLLVGALIPFRSGNKPIKNEIPVVTTVEAPSTFAPPETRPVTKIAPVQVVPLRPQATVIVPSVGVRVNHSIDAKTIARLTLRRGESVAILARHKPDTGPSWVKVKTRSGQEGWVFASVVQERNVKRL
jgi:hypothetical protein